MPSAIWLLLFATLSAQAAAPAADAIAAEREGRLQAAVELWSECIRAQPLNADLLVHRGRALAMSGRRAAAERDFMTAVRLRPALALAVEQARRAAPPATVIRVWAAAPAIPAVSPVSVPERIAPVPQPSPIPATLAARAISPIAEAPTAARKPASAATAVHASVTVCLALNSDEAPQTVTDLCSLAVDQDPYNPDVRLRRGLALLRADSLILALHDLAVVVRYRPALREAWVRSAEIKRKLGDIAGAEEDEQNGRSATHTAGIHQ